MGVAWQRQQRESKNCGKRLHRGSNRSWRDLCLNTNLLRTTGTSHTQLQQRLDCENRRHLHSILTRKCSNTRLLHVPTSRVLQLNRLRGVEAQQGHIRPTQQPKRMAETPCGSPSTTWTNPQRSRAEHIHDSNKRLLHTGVCRRPTTTWTNRQWTTSSTRFNNIYYRDLREHYTPPTLCPFSGATSPTKETTLKFHCPTATSTNYSRTTTCPHAIQQQHQGQHTWSQQQQQNMSNLYQQTSKQLSAKPLVSYGMTYTRPGISYATKELARSLTAPTTADQQKLKHLLRYLQGTKQHRQIIRPTVKIQASATPDLNVYVDSDWEGCSTARRSTTGFVITLLGTTINYGSRTQATIALSSAEVELCAINTGATEALHLRNLLMELTNVKRVNIRIHTDSSAGKSMATRIGSSRKAKHIELKHLFIQQLILNDIVRLIKIQTNDNPADILTKYVSTETLHRHLQSVGLNPHNSYHWPWQQQNKQFHQCAVSYCNVYSVRTPCAYTQTHPAE